MGFELTLECREFVTFTLQTLFATAGVIGKTFTNRSTSLVTRLLLSLICDVF